MRPEAGLSKGEAGPLPVRAGVQRVAHDTLGIGIHDQAAAERHRADGKHEAATGGLEIHHVAAHGDVAVRSAIDRVGIGTKTVIVFRSALTFAQSYRPLPPR